MKKTLLFLVYTVLTGTLLFSQSAPLSLPPAPPPSSPLVQVGISGNPGNTSYSYWVVANYPAGAVVSNTSFIGVAPNILTSQNFVTLAWGALAGATTYDVIRLVSNTSFNGTCTACAVSTGLTTNVASDTGGMLANYTMGSPAVSAVGSLYLNNRDYQQPAQLRQVVNGVDSPVGINAVIPGNNVTFEPTNGTVLTTVQNALNSAFIYDIGFTSLANACTGAINAGLTLAVTQKYSEPTESLACNMWFPSGAGGLIKPRAGAHVILTGTLTAAPFRIFDTSVGGAGSITLSGTQKLAIYTGWFGDLYNGTDAIAAWNSTVASCPVSGCQIHIPQNANSFTSTGIVLTHGVPINVLGEGRTSGISCSGVACITSNYAGQVISGIACQESNPNGNASTVCIEVTNSLGSGDQITIRDVLLIGKSAHPNGIGIRLDGVSNVTVDNVVSSGWARGAQLNAISGPIPSTTVHFLNSHFTGNSIWQIENNGCGDCTISQSIIESGPGLFTAAGSTTITGTHFESGSLDMEIASGAIGVTSIGNKLEGGTIQVDAGAGPTGTTAAVMMSYGDDFVDSVVNNSSFIIAAVWPFHVPLAANVTGNSIQPLLYNDTLGQHCLKASPGCTGNYTYTFDVPVISNAFSSPGTGTWQGNLIATGTAPVVSAGQTSFGGQTVASSFCGTLSGSVGCLKLNVAGTVAYIPVWE